MRQERELRIKLSEYKDEMLTKNNRKLSLDYDTLLFNYYEYLAICLYKKIINENIAKLYFRNLLISVKSLFENSILFKGNYSKKEDYLGILWLFRHWKI